MHACCPIGPGSMACATACSVCAVELASRACGAQCSAKSAPMVPGDLAVCHRLLAGCGETMGGRRAQAERTAPPAGAGQPSPSIALRALPSSARRRTFVNPQFAAFHDIAASAPLAEKNHQGFSWWKTLPKTLSQTLRAIRVDRRFLGFRGAVENNICTP